MKQKFKRFGSEDDDWATPKIIYNWIEKNIFKEESFFDPCPLRSSFDGLVIDWKQNNYINPPYNRLDKPKFIKKAFEEYLKGKTCVMLIPASTDLKDFHKYIVPHAKVILLEKRIKFKGHNSKGIYVENKCGQSGSMLIIFKKGLKAEITTLSYEGLINP